MYKGKLLTVLMIALFLSLSAATNVCAVTRIVPSAAYLTIQAAVNAASPGDTIYILNGTYYVPDSVPIGGALVNISKSLTLEGQSRDGVMLVGRTDKSGAGAIRSIKGILVAANNVTIKNLTVTRFKGGTGGESHGFGIMFRDLNDQEAYDGGRVENVRLLDNGYALAAYGTTNLAVADSLIQGNVSEGIYLSAADYSTITGNTVSDGLSGISLIASDTATISRNDISAAASQAILLSSSSSVTATENTISDNTGWGVTIGGTSDKIQLICNTIKNNEGGGVQITGTITNSRFDFNNIYGNTGFGAKNSTGVLLNFENNWWGDSSGPLQLTTHPLGLGDQVSAKIDYKPWLKFLKDMYWKDYNGKAPGGYMPDFDQNQNFDGIAGIEKNYCAPTAEADSLWWLAQKHGLNLGLTDVNGDGQTNVLDLVQELAVNMHTNVGHNGTYPADQLNGIILFLSNHQLDGKLYAHKMDKPTFAWIEQEVKSCEDVKLDLGFWHVEKVEKVGSRWKVTWGRCGGHAVDVAGVDSNNSFIALSDPDANNAEAGLAGIVRGPNHIDPLGHNDAVSASHDIFHVGLSKSPGGLYGLTDPYWRASSLCQRYMENNGEYTQVVKYYRTTTPPVQVSQVYTEIEAVVAVSPKINMVIQPNGGEIIPSGLPYTIKWSAPAGAVKYRLMYSVDNGTTWESIKEPDADGAMIPVVVAGTSYVWTVPAPPNSSNQSLVKVIAYDASDDPIGPDTSDSTFTIKVLDVTSPDGGEIFTSGDVWVITWQTYETIRDVATTSLSYSLNGGTSWTLIKTLTGNPEWYVWTVPPVASAKTHCKVKVELKDSGNVIIGNDVSGSADYPDFTIKPL